MAYLIVLGLSRPRVLRVGGDRILQLYTARVKARKPPWLKGSVLMSHPRAYSRAGQGPGGPACRGGGERLPAVLSGRRCRRPYEHNPYGPRTIKECSELTDRRSECPYAGGRATWPPAGARWIAFPSPDSRYTDANKSSNPAVKVRKNKWYFSCSLRLEPSEVTTGGAVRWVGSRRDVFKPRSGPNLR